MPRAPRSVEWTRETLIGPAGLLVPWVSPDGQLVAFEAMIGGQVQVALIKLETDYTVLTHQANRGEIEQMAWSRDGSKIYFDRYSGARADVFSVPVLGGEPRLILEGGGRSSGSG